MKILEVLKGAREILAAPERWHKGYYYNDARTAFCILGACNQVGGYRCEDMNGISARAEDLAAQAIKPCIADVQYEDKDKTRNSVPGFNDSPDVTHPQILAALDCAIARLETP